MAHRVHAAHGNGPGAALSEAVCTDQSSWGEGPAQPSDQRSPPRLQPDGWHGCWASNCRTAMIGRACQSSGGRRRRQFPSIPIPSPAGRDHPAKAQQHQRWWGRPGDRPLTCGAVLAGLAGLAFGAFGAFGAGKAQAHQRFGDGDAVVPGASLVQTPQLPSASPGWTPQRRGLAQAAHHPRDPCRHQWQQKRRQLQRQLRRQPR